LSQCAVLKQAKKELEEYFSGTRNTFDVKIAPKGTDFQQSVWKGLQKIPYGTTCSYGDVATLIGKNSSVGEQWHVNRAIGTANSRNPLLVVVPCHRVIGKNGKLVGYSAGVNIKQKLLDLETKYKKNFPEEKSVVKEEKKLSKEEKKPSKEEKKHPLKNLK